MLRIRYLSDLHIECSNFKINYDDCDIIILAGDISSEIDYLPYILNNIPSHIQIYMIAGNHEYENQLFGEYPQKLEKFLKDNEFNNIHFLDNEFVDIGDVRIIGSTLWSDCRGYFIYHNVFDIAKYHLLDESIQNGILNHIHVYHENSLLPNKVLSVDLMKQEFQKSYNFIKNSLTNEKKCVVVTHFAPIFNAVLEYNSRPVTPISSFWANHIPELTGIAKYWIHGHIHSSFSQDINGTKVLSNPRGNSNIANKVENVHFNPLATIEI